MHRSRLTSIIFDLPETQHDQGRRFWSSVFGQDVVSRNARYSSLEGRIGKEGGVYIGFQNVQSEAYDIHFDIETDDVEAEVTRLQAIGATVKKRIRRHVVMQSPTGQAFCVVPVRRGDFPKGATLWP